jgi:hypothetical protein
MDSIVISNTHTNCATTVFISGSISIKALGAETVCLLDSMIAKKQAVLIGVAFGVDKLVQQYLFKRDFQFVTVYFSGTKVRNNIDNWQTKQITNDNNLTGRSMYQLKDVAMAQDTESKR